MDLVHKEPSFTKESFIGLLDLNSSLSEKLESTVEENRRLQQKQKNFPQYQEKLRQKEQKRKDHQ